MNWRVTVKYRVRHQDTWNTKTLHLWAVDRVAAIRQAREEQYASAGDVVDVRVLTLRDGWGRKLEDVED